MDHPSDTIPTCRVLRDGVEYTINRRDLGQDEVAVDDTPPVDDAHVEPGSALFSDPTVLAGEASATDHEPPAYEGPADTPEG